MPAVPPAGDPGTFAWLRAGVARFSRGADHRRRRELAVRVLEAAPPAKLYAEAARETTREIDAAGGAPFDAMSRVAHRVPVAVLGRAIGFAADPAAIQVIARSLRPGATPGGEADSAVAAALEGRAATERTAAVIGVLVQASDATAGLIGNALLARDRDVERVVATNPPVRSTRRTEPDGTAVVVDLAALGLPFGAGLHACPGRGHALALAGGAAEVLLARCAVADDDVPLESAPNLRMPARVIVAER